jgi:type VI protein secretion system component VasA
LSEQGFLLAVKTSIGALCLPFSSRIEDLLFLRVKLRIFELTATPVANMFH